MSRRAGRPPRRTAKRRRLALVLERDRLVAGLVEGDRVLAAAAADLPEGVVADGAVDEPARLGAAIRRLARALGLKAREAREAIAAIGGPGVLVKTVVLPPMPAAERPAVTRAMVEPYVVFGGEEIEVAVEPEESADPDAGCLVAAARRSHLLALAGAVAAAGLDVTRIEARALALWRAAEATRRAAAGGGEPADQPAGNLEVTAIAEGDGILLLFRSGLRTVLVHRVDLEVSPDADPEAAAGAVAATLELAQKHLAARLGAEPRVTALAWMAPGSEAAAARLASALPGVRIEPLGDLTGRLGLEPRDALAAATLAGLAAGLAAGGASGDGGASGAGAVPLLDLTPADVRRRQALGDELRALASAIAATWSFLCLASLATLAANDRLAARAEVDRQRLGEPLAAVLRIKRLEATMAGELETLGGLERIAAGVPRGHARTVRALASCVPAGLSIEHLELTADGAALTGLARGESQVMLFLAHLRDLEAASEIGKVELGAMRRELRESARLTRFELRVLSRATVLPAGSPAS